MDKYFSPTDKAHTYIYIYISKKFLNKNFVNYSIKISLTIPSKNSIKVRFTNISLNKKFHMMW